VPVIGLHCSHEQVPPSRLLADVREAEAAGFRAAMSSDHFSPGSERQGESGFAWSFLGAALHATELDGLVTVNQPRERLERVVGAFRVGGGEDKPVHLQVHLSWAESEAEALQIAHEQWRTNALGPPLAWDLETVEQFDQAAAYVRPEDVRAAVLVSADLSRHAAWLQGLAELGFEQIHLHHVGQDLGSFIQKFGERVLPEVAW